MIIKGMSTLSRKSGFDYVYDSQKSKIIIVEKLQNLLNAIIVLGLDESRFPEDVIAC